MKLRQIVKLAMIISFTLFLTLSLKNLVGCDSSVQLKAPEKPIAVNIDMNIKHQIEVDNKLDKAMTDNKHLF